MSLGNSISSPAQIRPMITLQPLHACMHIPFSSHKATKLVSHFFSEKQGITATISLERANQPFWL